MTSVIVEADRRTLFDQNDGATRIFMIHQVHDADLRVGLHRHEGDEIWRVRRGRIRMTVGEERFEIGAGELVVIPPNTVHGIAVLEDQTDTEVIGELHMGEWVIVLDSDGERREVETYGGGRPWHRPPPEGQPPTGLDEFLAMMQSTAHLL